MCKKLLTLLLLLGVLVSFPAFVQAENDMLESPNIKIIIDGKLGTYDDVPLTVNGRTMLPLRALLTNLGVPDDDAHILWNEAEQSVTVNNDGTKIYLKVGSSTAYLNDAPVTLDAEPIKYSKNNRVYIPARFVAQALGKKVVWDGSAYAVFITDEAQFNAVKDLLDRCDTAAAEANKYKMLSDMTLSAFYEDKAFHVKSFEAKVVDKQEKTMYTNFAINVMDMSMSTESYYDGNIAYDYNPDTGWSKRTLSQEEYDSVFRSNSSTDNLEEYDAVYAGLLIVGGTEADEIMLKGDAYIKRDFMKEFILEILADGQDGFELEFNKFDIEISLYKNSYFINYIRYNIEGYMSKDTDRAEIKLQCYIKLSDYNGDFRITVPREAIDNAVEY